MLQTYRYGVLDAMPLLSVSDPRFFLLQSTDDLWVFINGIKLVSGANNHGDDLGNALNTKFILALGFVGCSWYPSLHGEHLQARQLRPEERHVLPDFVLLRPPIKVRDPDQGKLALYNVTCVCSANVPRLRLQFPIPNNCDAMSTKLLATNVYPFSTANVANVGTRGPLVHPRGTSCCPGGACFSGPCTDPKTVTLVQEGQISTHASGACARVSLYRRCIRC